MSKPRQYEELIVWKLAHELCIEMYRLVRGFPTHERFALSSQIRRAAYSVPMNIVEGNVKRSSKEKLHFIEYSEASLDELDYQLMLSSDLGYLAKDELQKLQISIRKLSFLLSRFRSGIMNRSKTKSSASLASSAS